MKQINNTAHITKWLLEKGEDEIASYRRDYVIGSEFSQIDLEKLRNTSPDDIEKYINFPMPAMDMMYMTYPNVTIMNGLYNSVPVHSRPLAVNLISNTLLGHLDMSNNSRRITITNHPLPFTSTVNRKFYSLKRMQGYIII